MPQSNNTQGNNTQSNPGRRNLIWIAVMLAMGLGPLAAFSIGERYASEETMARAEAGRRNYDPPDRYPDAHYGLPDLEGEAAETTVRDITGNSALFEQYRAAVEQAGFGDVLEGPGPFTLFVPLDDAFTELPDAERQSLFEDDDKLLRMLSNHVVVGRLSATDLLQRRHVDSIGGQRIDIDKGGQSITYGNADIVQTDLVAGNGVVHIVDSLNL